MRKIDEICLFEAFIAVSKYKNLRLAAKDLEISKPSVLRRINKLEEIVGLSLFDRNEKGSVLTSQGQILLDSVLPIYDRYIKAIVPDIRASIKTEVLNISAPYSLGISLIIPWVSQFQSLHPNALIDLSLTLGPVRLLPANCDIRFSHGALPSERVLTKPLGVMPRIMVASPKYLAKNGVPKNPKDLENHSLLGSQDLTQNSSFLLHRNDEFIHVNFRPRLRLQDHTAAREAAIAGAGIAVHALKHDTIKQVQRGELIQILPEWLPEACPISMLFPLSKNISPLCEQFITFVQDKWVAHPHLALSDI